MNRQSELTQEYIFGALLLLIEKKDLSKITITELTKKAGVSRMAFYRNYDCKEDVIITCFDKFFSSYLKSIKEDYKEISVDSIRVYFSFFRKYQGLVKCLIKSNLSIIILESSVSFLTDITREFICDDPDDYMINFMAGGLYQVIVKWIEKGMIESDEEIAKVVLAIMFNE